MTKKEMQFIEDKFNILNTNLILCNTLLSKLIQIAKGDVQKYGKRD